MYFQEKDRFTISVRSQGVTGSKHLTFVTEAFVKSDTKKRKL